VRLHAPPIPPGPARPGPHQAQHRVELTEGARKFKYVLAAIAGADKRPNASWLEIDRPNFTGTVKTAPVREDLNEPEIREQLIVEYYSR
jgi:small subunit ribosomal protein S4